MSKAHKVEIIKHTEINEIVFYISEFTYKLSHIHKDMELDLVLDGHFFVRTNDEFYEAGAGSILVFNPYKPHEFMSLGKPCLVMTIHVQKKFCENYFPAFGHLMFTQSNISATKDHVFLERLRYCIFNLAYNYYLEEFGFELRCYSDLNAMVYLLVKSVPFEIFGENQGAEGMYQDSRLYRLLDYIEKHYQNKITLKTLAAREGISVSYLSHFIRQHLGMSFQSYVNMLRFERAIQLLVQTDRKLVDICLESGFSESKYFNKIFSRDYHMKPKDFRRMAKNSWGSAVPDFERGGRTFYAREDCLAILRSFFHYTCDEPEKMPEAGDIFGSPAPGVHQ